MAEGGPHEFSHSLMKASEDGDLSKSIRTGNNFVYDFYCEPCDWVDIHVEATAYCKNCKEYMCKKCSKFHIRFKQLRDHTILDVQHMRHRPPIRKKRSVSTKTFTKATHMMDIHIWDSKRIKSFVLMSSKMLFVSTFNHSFILMSTRSGREVSRLKLSGQVGQVTMINDTEAAVTVPREEKIVLLRTCSKLSVVREISVQGECCGIAYMDGKFIVALREGHVNLLDMSGKVIRTISPLRDQKGRQIFYDPHYVLVSRVTGSKYVSDLVDRWLEQLLHEADSGKQLAQYLPDWERPRNHRLVKLSMEGKVEATYDCSEGDKPCQVDLDSQGMIYIARSTTRMLGLIDTFCVEQLSADCEKVRTIFSNLSSLPWALSYDKATQQLFVALRHIDDLYTNNDSTNVLKVYRLS